MRAQALVAAVLCGVSLATYGHASVRVFEREEPELHLDLFGFVQPRFTAQSHDEREVIDFRPNPAFTVPRARFGAIAGDDRWARLVFEMDLGKEVALPLDAYLVLSPLRHRWATLELTLGQFRVPFSRQNLLSSRTFQLPDPAYFVSPKFLVDRDIGAMLGGELLDGRGRWYAGVFNGNDPGRGQQLNLDPYFLWAGRVEISPLGRPPAFEGDVRPLEERRRPLVTLGAGAMLTRQEDKDYERRWLGADLGFWWQGASLYVELYKRCDSAVDGGDRLCMPEPDGPVTTPPQISARGANAQLGYFPHVPWVQEHLELVGRFEWFDPNEDVDEPENDVGARDLDQSNPTWGYVGIIFGLNAYFSLERGHDLKLQATYEIRNETKGCLAGQTGAGCTGHIENDLFVIQATAGF